jgi:CRISPR-associated protein Cas2
MTVIILERVPASLRGELTRWLLEPRTGVFVGRPSAMVRDKLWELVGDKLKGGAALLIYRSDTEQGFTMLTTGNTARTLRDFEGLTLVVH